MQNTIEKSLRNKEVKDSLSHKWEELIQEKFPRVKKIKPQKSEECGFLKSKHSKEKKMTEGSDCSHVNELQRNSKEE